MDRERYEAAKRLFMAALDRPEGERDAFVEAEAGPNRTLLEDVLGLLGAHDRSGDVLDGAALDALAVPGPDRLPEMVAGYRILALLGRGGMGAVYRARRGEEAEVALKVLDAGILSGRLSTRLRR
ncbi:MAG: hypothetical protein ACHQ52_08635, partial [Candidatus Eisenbacteria bacterium]